jgi:hypothetical protein
MLNKYSLLSDDRATEYGMWADKYNRLAGDRDYYGNAYYNEQDFDYGKYSDDRNLAYTDHRAQIGDSQWLANFNEAVRQFNENFAYKQEQDKITNARLDKELDHKTAQSGDTNTNHEDGNDPPAVEAFTGTTYKDAVAYLKANGVPSGEASGIEDSATWHRKWNSYKATGEGSAEVYGFNSYQEYLEDVTKYLISKYA